MVHPALTFAPTLQRALAVTQAEQQLRQARTIRDKETAIFEASITDINPRGELSEALVDLHTRVTDVELSHDQLIPQRISTSHALHAHIRDSVLTSAIKTAAMLKEVLSWPDKTPNSAFSINNDLDTLIRVFTMRKEILRAVREARGGCSELLDHFNTLHTMGCAWERRQHPVSEKIISLHDEIASLLVEIEEHIGSDQETRNNRLLSLSQATGPLIAQDSTRLQSKVENWFRWSADGSDATRDVTADRAIEISSWIISRMTQLDELISSLKKSNGALSLRLAATTALDKAEMASIEECIAASSLMLKGADDLEKSFLDPNAVFSKEDVVKHAFDVFDRNAKLVGSDGVKRVQRDASNLVKDTYQELEIVKALWESKRLFQLDGRPLDSHSQPNSEIFDPSSAPTFASQASRASVPDAGASTSHRSPPDHPPVMFGTNKIPHKGEPYEDYRWIFKHLFPAGFSHPYQAYSFFKTFDVDQSEGTGLHTVSDSYMSPSGLRTWVKPEGRGVMSFDINTLGLTPRDHRFWAGTYNIDSYSDWNTELNGERVAAYRFGFGRPFRTTPSVRLFISGLTFNDPGSFSSSSWADDVNTDGFTLRVKVGNGRAGMAMSIRWIAHDPNESTVRSGVIEHDSDVWEESIDGTIRFDPPFTTGTPSVLATGIAGFDFELPQCYIQEANVSSKGLDFVAGSSRHSRMKHGRWSWLAIA